MKVGPLLPLLAILMSVSSADAAAQNPSWPAPQWYLGAGLHAPQRDLPRRVTPWGIAAGRFSTGPALSLDGVFPGRARPLRFYVQALAAGTTVRWEGGPGEGVAGVAGSLTGGAEAGLTAGHVRPYARLGIGAHGYVLATDNACTLMSRTCGLAHTYASNFVDPAVQASAGLEFKLSGRAVVLTVSSVWSDFEIPDGSASQRSLSLAMGLGL